MKEIVSAAVGMTAGMISWLTGGFDTPVLALVICMGVDYATGLIVAGVFHTSPKTDGESGRHPAGAPLHPGRGHCGFLRQ